MKVVVSDLVEEVKVNLGEFKPKRKFLNFISGVNGARVRFIRDIAFLKVITIRYVRRSYI
jgi:hypothetical protein